MTQRSPRVRTAAVVWGAMALLGLTACEKASAPAAVEQVPDTQVPSAPPSQAGVPSGTVRPSLLINQEQPFPADKVERLRQLREVEQLALIGYGMVSIYDHQVPTATIDPLTYRPFTPLETQSSAPVWAAITKGEALVSHTVGVRDHLPLEATVPAGWATVRIAGLATTVPGIDMIVSPQTGERIGVPYGNGLVVGVAGDPGRTTERIRHILGSKVVIRRIARHSATSAAPGSPGSAGSLLPAITPPAAAPPAAIPSTTPPATLPATASATAAPRPAHRR